MSALPVKSLSRCTSRAGLRASPNLKKYWRRISEFMADTCTVYRLIRHEKPHQKRYGDNALAGRTAAAGAQKPRDQKDREAKATGEKVSLIHYIGCGER